MPDLSYYILLTTYYHLLLTQRLEYVPDLSGLLSSSSDGALQLSDLGRGACVARHRLTNPSSRSHFPGRVWGAGIGSVPGI